MKKSNVFGLILAAGLSSRMGAYKPLLQYNGKSFLQNVILKLNLVCDKIIIVTGFHSKEIKANVKKIYSKEIKSKIQFLYNRNYEAGMFSSLKKGSEECSKADWVLYHFIDQPTIPDEFYFKFIKKVENKFDWIQPTKNGKNGHPILFGKNIIAEIIKSDMQNNLRNISQRNSIIKKYWECDFAQIFDDFDTLEEYNNLVQLPVDR